MRQAKREHCFLVPRRSSVYNNRILLRVALKADWFQCNQCQDHKGLKDLIQFRRHTKARCAAFWLVLTSGEFLDLMHELTCICSIFNVGIIHTAFEITFAGVLHASQSFFDFSCTNILFLLHFWIFLKDAFASGSVKKKAGWRRRQWQVVLVFMVAVM